MTNGTIRLLFAALISYVMTLPAPACADTVKYSDLEGLSATAKYSREQTIRVRRRRSVVKIDETWSLTFASDEVVQYTIGSTLHSRRGTRKRKPRSKELTLNQLVKIRRAGGGHAIMTFSNGMLVFVRTFPSGALRSTFGFERMAGKLTCSFNEIFAREKGKGPVKFRSSYSGREITVLKSKLTSSACKVTKAKAGN